MSKVIYCPLDKTTNCGYWGVFGGHLDLFVRGFRRHLWREHRDTEGLDRRSVVSLIDRWLGDALVKAFGEEQR